MMGFRKARKANARMWGIACAAFLAASMPMFSEGASETSSTTPSAAVAYAKEISVFHFFKDWPQMATPFSKLNAEFTQKTGIVVKEVAAGWSDADTKFNLMVASGDFPDVAFPLLTFNLQQLADGDIFAEIPKELAASVFRDDLVVPRDSRNRAYAIPLFGLASGIVYHADVLKKTGLSVPQTWQQFLRACGIIKAQGTVPLALNSVSGAALLNLSVAAELGESAPSFFGRWKAKSAGFNNRDICTALEKLAQLQPYVDSSWATATAGVTKDFKAKKYAMMLASPSTIPSLKSQLPSLDLGFTGLPGIQGGVPSVVYQGWPLVVLFRTKNNLRMAAANLYVKTLMEPGVLSPLAEIMGGLPAIMNAPVKAPGYSDVADSIRGTWKLNGFFYSEFTNKGATIPDFGETFTTNLPRMMAGAMTSVQLMDAQDAVITKAMGPYNASADQARVTTSLAASIALNLKAYAPSSTASSTPAPQPAKIPVLAVLDFSVENVAVADARTISDYLGSMLASTKRCQVIDRATREALLSGSGLSRPNYADESLQLQLGRWLSASRIVVGSIGKVSDRYMLSVKVLAVDTGSTMSSTQKAFKSLNDLVDGCEAIATTLLGS